MAIQVLQRPITDCCGPQVPAQFTGTSPAMPVSTSPQAVLSPPQPAFNPCGEVIYHWQQGGCIVEGPIAANVNSPCGLQVSCSLILQKPIVAASSSVPCRGGVSASTTVQPVNIQNAPEPPNNQPIGRAVPMQGQAPGAINVSIHSNATMTMLVFGVILVGLYFISR